MIADWTVDVGPDSPSIDVPWEGWVDLRCEWIDTAVRELCEIQAYPELIEILRLVNNAGLFTSKVDVFPIGRDEVDPEVAEAGEEETRFGLGSYLDVLANPPPPSLTFEHFEVIARRLAAALGKITVAVPCSAEIMVRPASLFGRETFGWTVYVSGFGPSAELARTAWRSTVSLVTAQLVAQIAGLYASGHNVQVLSRLSDS